MDNKKPSKQNQSSNNLSKKKPYNSYLKYSAIGFQMIGIIIIGVLIGTKLDSYFELEKPLMTALFSLLFVIAAIYLSLRDFIGGK
ncbi:MAG: hypothetical protein HKN92_07845 [Chitinophagales bacterium]|nr:hypothetical protein [Chitinophagales bacterium]